MIVARVLVYTFSCNDRYVKIVEAINAPCGMIFSDVGFTCPLRAIGSGMYAECGFGWVLSLGASGSEKNFLHVFLLCGKKL